MGDVGVSETYVKAVGERWERWGWVDHPRTKSRVEFTVEGSLETVGLIREKK